MPRTLLALTKSCAVDVALATLPLGWIEPPCGHHGRQVGRVLSLGLGGHDEAQVDRERHHAAQPDQGQRPPAESRRRRAVDEAQVAT